MLVGELELSNSASHAAQIDRSIVSRLLVWVLALLLLKYLCRRTDGLTDYSRTTRGVTQAHNLQNH